MLHCDDEMIDALNDGSMLYSINDKEYLNSMTNSEWKHGKVDIVIWSKNGDKTLDQVMKRINEVIPKEVINNRILVNDHSIDGTPWIVVTNGWRQIINEGNGISDAANTALKYVTTDYFISIEQDVLLSSLWWGCISKLVEQPNFVAASGVRLLPIKHSCYGVEAYNLRHQNGYGKTLDNTLWNTAKLRELGGFPKLSCAGIDTYLAEQINAKGYKWLVDPKVQSLHLHYGFKKELERYRFYGQSLPELYHRLKAISKTYSNESASRFFSKLLKSPYAAYRMSKDVGDARLMYSYPLVRLYWLLGYLKGRGNYEN